MWGTLLDEKMHLKLANDHMDTIRRRIKADQLASEVERNRPTPDAELTQAGSRSSDGLSPLMDAIPDGV